eukprot:scaffold39294_cov320-Isochrysis_galbana.AAC.1
MAFELINVLGVLCTLPPGASSANTAQTANSAQHRTVCACDDCFASVRVPHSAWAISGFRPTIACSS